MESRRDHLKIIGAVGATCAFPFSADELYGQHEHAASKAPTVGPFEPKFFSAEEGRLVSRLTDLIIPPTDSPGAVDAGVPQYIDMVLQKNEGHRTVIREGLLWLDQQASAVHGKKFVELTDVQQVTLLEPLAEAADSGQAKKPGAEFFQVFKNLTADGYYTSYAGLVQELGYKGNQALPTFPGCTHEH